MKNLELEYGTSELNFDEQRDTDGGGPISRWVADAVAWVRCSCHAPNGWTTDASGDPVPIY